jgi:hypothetical protein
MPFTQLWRIYDIMNGIRQILVTKKPERAINSPVILNDGHASGGDAVNGMMSAVGGWCGIPGVATFV